MNALFLTICIVIVLTTRAVYAIVIHMSTNKTIRVTAHITHGVVIIAVVGIASLHLALNLLGVHV